MARLVSSAERASAEAQGLIAAATETLERELGGEFERLTALKRVNPSVRDAEIEALAMRLTALRAALPQARVRLDAIRLAVSPDFLKLVAS